MISVQVNTKDVQKVLDQFAATPAQVERARTRALRKISRRVSSQILAEVARKERIPKRSLKGRVFISPVRPKDTQAEIFIGTLPLDAMRVGTPAQTKRGVRVGRHTYTGAFLKRIFAAREKVWVRKSSKHYDPARYPTRHRAGDRGAFSDPSLFGRFPVVRAAIPINATAEDVIQGNMSGIAQDFLRVLRQELHYEIYVRQ